MTLLSALEPRTISFGDDDAEKADRRIRNRNNMRRYRANNKSAVRRRELIDMTRRQLKRAIWWRARIPAIEEKLRELARMTR